MERSETSEPREEDRKRRDDDGALPVVGIASTRVGCGCRSFNARKTSVKAPRSGNSKKGLSEKFTHLDMAHTVRSSFTATRIRGERTDWSWSGSCGFRAGLDHRHYTRSKYKRQDESKINGLRERVNSVQHVVVMGWKCRSLLVTTMSGGCAKAPLNQFKSYLQLESVLSRTLHSCYPAFSNTNNFSCSQTGHQVVTTQLQSRTAP